jgi:GNAT superfamily N-acetyltransferase
MANIEIEHLSDPVRLFEENEVDVCEAGATAFGRGYDDFAEDVKDHFMGATHGHLMRVEGAIAGFSLYTLMENNGLYLEGVAVARVHQGHGLGTKALVEAVRYFGSEYIAATTRNPATVKLISGVSSYSSPDIRLGEPLQHHEDARIQEVLGLLASNRLRPQDADTLPFLLDKYPPALYGQDPGEAMPLSTIADSSRNAVVVVGVV